MRISILQSIHGRPKVGISYPPLFILTSSNIRIVMRLSWSL